MAVMLLAMKTRNVIGAFRSVLIVTVKQSFIDRQIVGCPVIRSLVVGFA